MGKSPGCEEQEPQESGGDSNPPEEVESEALLGGRGHIHIRHGGQRYCLRRTGKGGLILTK